MAKRWTRKQDQALLMGLGAYGVSWFFQRVGKPHDYNFVKWCHKYAPQHRSRAALYCRVRRLCDGGGLGRGAYSLRQLLEKSGYSKCQIMRAREALNQKWKRITPKGSYIVTEEQADDVIEWLKHDYWCSKHKLYCCAGCESKRKPHHSGGLCYVCHVKAACQLKVAGLPRNTKAMLTRLSAWERANLSADDHQFVSQLRAQLTHGRATRWQDIQRLRQLPSITASTKS